MASSGPHVQAKFFTKQPQFTVSEDVFSVPATVTTLELNDLINGLLNSADGDGESLRRDFDFLVEGEFLRLPLNTHMQNKSLTAERVVSVEFLLRQPAPEPSTTIQQEDWISSVQGNRDCILSGSYDSTVQVWTRTGQSLVTGTGHTEPVKAVAWVKQEATGGQFLSASQDQLIVLWDWDREGGTAVPSLCCRGHARSVDCLATHPTADRFASGSWDKMIKLWSLGDAGEEEEEERPRGKKKAKQEQLGPTRTPLMTLQGHSEAVTSVAWVDDVTLCSASWDHTIRTWDAEAGVPKETLTGSKAFHSVSYSNLSHLLASGSSDRHVRLWDLRSQKGVLVESTLTAHQGWVSAVAWSPTNQYHLISASYDKTLKLWDTRSPRAPLYNMSGHREKLLCADWSTPDLLICGGAEKQLCTFSYSNLLTSMPDRQQGN
ncbi:ribosome biogenesis protein wdr12-like [Branchiostoma lanceolatum]|uniref:ribosome biogenesis protein wdr12-like n=1 Tax=Branchiostoma lanceolatum TaxID=7740 RepID=UPI0034511F8F